MKTIKDHKVTEMVNEAMDMTKLKITEIKHGTTVLKQDAR